LRMRGKSQGWLTGDWIMEKILNDILMRYPVKLEICTRRCRHRSDCFGCYKDRRVSIVLPQSAYDLAVSLIHELCHFYFERHFGNKRVRIRDEERIVDYVTFRFIAENCLGKVNGRALFYGQTFLTLRTVIFKYRFKERSDRMGNMVDRIYMEVCKKVKL